MIFSKCDILNLITITMYKFICFPTITIFRQLKCFGIGKWNRNVRNRNRNNCHCHLRLKKAGKQIVCKNYRQAKFSPNIRCEEKRRWNVLRKSLNCVYTHRFNFLTHAFSFLNRNIPNQNFTYCISFLPWFGEMNLGLAHLALKMHAFFACVNACRNSA